MGIGFNTSIFNKGISTNVETTGSIAYQTQQNTSIFTSTSSTPSSSSGSTFCYNA